MQVFFYLIIVIALAGSAYYGWTAAKRAQNREETRAQARIRQGLGLVQIFLVLVGLVFVSSLISGLLQLTGNSHLLESGLRAIFGSGVSLEESSHQITLFGLLISLLHPLINGGLLLILRRFLKGLYEGERALETLVQPLNWAGHLLLLKAFISPGIFSLGQADQAVSFLNFGYVVAALLFYSLARLIDKGKA